MITSVFSLQFHKGLTTVFIAENVENNYNQITVRVADVGRTLKRRFVMRSEYGVSRSQLRGYIFEIAIFELLLKNGFSAINVATEPRERVREIREGFVELKGRGCWHQIDCPCEYQRPIPFSYPLRLIGEVKFYKSPLEKKYIREFIEVIKDIQENYFVADGMNSRDFYARKNNRQYNS